MAEWVKVKASDGQELAAYVARPEGEPVGAVVIVQEIFGVNSHIRSVADGYARDGFVAIAPALFDRIEPGVELDYSDEGMKRAFTQYYPKLNPELSLKDVAAAAKFVEGTGKGTAVVGFCYGGLMAWLSATRGASEGFSPVATVGYYAGGIGKVATETPSCPVMLHFGAEDDHIGRDQIDAVRNAHPEVQVFLYEGAGHAFNRQPDPKAYREEQAKVARERTLGFLRGVMKAGA